ncbi:MAG: phosphoglucosamine mutase [Planctomycetota bacterium]|nr:phosphoglucosamine mutase [Planctomycetota bacterium]
MSTDTPPPPLMLSVSGARGLVGSTMTPAVAARFVRGFGEEIRSLDRTSRPKLVIGRDGRASGAELAEAAARALSDSGCDIIDVGVAMTPTVGIMIRTLGAQGGIAITASHNPIEWNGIKCLDSDGLAPPPEIANRIIERFTSGWEPDAVNPDPGTITREDTGDRTHVDRVLNLVDVERIRSRGLSVVLDSVNASGCRGGRMLLEELGCTLEHLNGEQTGVFAHTPEPIEENLTELARLVRINAAAACGFAQDPDADRLAIVDDRGRYIGEEYTLVLAAFRHLQANGPCPLVANLSTSRMIDDLAARFPGSTVHRTSVGEANVVKGMREFNAPLGGEGNGGVIASSIGWVRDSLVAMALTLELIAVEERSLSSIVEELPRYEMIKQKIDLSALGGREVIPDALRRLVESHPPERVNSIDGVRIDLPEGWVHVRASNTEPILRVISEAATRNEAERLAHDASIAAGIPAG